MAGRIIGDGITCPAPFTGAWLASAAAAIEILLHIPLRIRNLQELRIGQELRLTAVTARRWRGELSVNYVRVKNKEPLSMPLGADTIALLRDYLENHRGSLANASTNWFFPGAASPERPRDKQAFGQAISEAIQEFVGVRVNRMRSAPLPGPLSSRQTRAASTTSAPSSATRASRRPSSTTGG